MAANKLWSLGRLAHRCTKLTIVQPTIHFGRFYATEGKTNTPKSTIKLLLISMGVGGAIGTGYSSYISYTKSVDFTTVTEEKLPAIVDHLPDIKITKKFVNPNDKSNLDLILFQFQTCPFCCKVNNETCILKRLKF